MEHILFKIQLNPESAVSIYQQLVEAVIDLIHDGKLVEGDALPATRDLAKALRLNRNTVVRGYRQLQDMGVIVSRVGQGTVVAPVAAATSSPAVGTAVETPASKSILWSELLSSVAQNLNNVVRPASAPEDIWLSRMQPSADLLPIDTFRECIDAVLTRSGAAALMYANTSGVPRLRELICDELKQMGVDTELNEVIVTSGSSQGLDLVLRALIDPGDKVLVEEPTYHGGIQLLKMVGATLVPLPSDANGPDLSRLAPNALHGVKAVYLIPNFRNPTATSISAERRAEIAAWANRNGLLVIEDDYGFEFGFDAPTPAPIRSLAPDNVIYINSFSKRLMPALRLGYIVVPRGRLAEKLHTMKWVADLGTSSLLQYALAEFIDRGHYAAHLGQIVPEYRRRRQIMHDALTRHMPTEVSWRYPAGGLFFWITLPAGFNVDALIHNCRQRHLQISGGRAWSATGEDLPGIRLAFCSETAANIQDGIAVLGSVIKEMLGKNRGAQLPMSASLV